MLCSNCKRSIPEDSRFCHHCAADLRSAREPCGQDASAPQPSVAPHEPPPASEAQPPPAPEVPQNLAPSTAGALPEERRASSNSLLIAVVMAILIAFLALVGAGAYVAVNILGSKPPVEITADAQGAAQPSADVTGQHGSGAESPHATEKNYREDASGPTVVPTEQTAVIAAGSLDPFPTTLTELRDNPAALAAAQTLGSYDSLPLEDYGDEWVLEYMETRGPFVFLLVEVGEFHGYVALLRETSDSYEYLMGMQDVPGVADFKAAGITPAEYRDHLLDHWGQWPWTESGGTASDW